jgi:predicted metal-dependent HD superfamily phosphohydrolase
VNAIQLIQEYWLAACEQLKIPKMRAASMWNFVGASYQIRGDTYHGLEHPPALFAAAADHPAVLRLDVDELAILHIGIVMHDAVYNPYNPFGTNEGLSAQLSNILLNASYLDHPIRCTTHRGEAQTTRAALLCDIDLSPLAQPWEEFAINTAKIRAEYDLLTDEQFAKGRVIFCEGQLARPSLFYLNESRALWEEKARANLLRERDRHVLMLGSITNTEGKLDS